MIWTQTKKHSLGERGCHVGNVLPCWSVGPKKWAGNSQVWMSLILCLRNRDQRNKLAEDMTFAS